ncbi:unnamed protein product [Brassicogethes aeneus]|uniref:HTH psq-type domain-containing protein n=1 Tax=Brassicogethes aeneus TaxID=1431903 RepID=A0A9P0AZY5_BRAAE|nr:unnamed protein product [Brassicogethes aeneus]
MPRIYQKNIGGGPYKNYNGKTMQTSIEAVKKGSSQLAASKKLKVPRTTLIDKLHQDPNSLRQPPMLTEEDERLISDTLGTTIQAPKRFSCPENDSAWRGFERIPGHPESGFLMIYIQVSKPLRKLDDWGQLKRCMDTARVGGLHAAF